ncbi:MAG: hypothetical protein ACOCU4_09550 [Alkalispirochaeta sp.]
MHEKVNEKPVRVLLVEDQAIIAMQEEQMLRNAGYEVTKAPTGEKALSIVDESSQDGSNDEILE